MKKVLIFGIGGFVGRYLAQEFLDNGYSVCGSDIGKKEGLQEEVQYFEADLMDSDKVAKLVVKVSPDIIINLAAISSVGASWGFRRRQCL